MRLCVVSFKECWPDASGRWYSFGGFPVQMAAVGSLFDEMTLVVVRGRPRAGALALPSRARVIALRRPAGDDARRKASLLAHLPYYVRAIAAGMHGADVVHVPLPGDISFLGMLVALAMRKRLIARYGGSWAVTAQTTVMNRVIRECMRRCAGGRNVMLATGDGASPPAPGISWIFASALLSSDLRRIVPRTDGTLARPPRLVYAGRLSPEKGVAVLVRAVAQLDARSFAPLPHVTLAGDGPERGALETLVRRLGCERLISFAGQLDRDALSRELSAADVCVQPSLSEGYSKAWLDAFAHGLPVVTSRVGAAEHVVGANGERGWLVPPGDVDALAATLARVLAGDVDWAAMRRRCRAYVESRTVDAWARALAERCAQQWSDLRLADGRVIA